MFFVCIVVLSVKLCPTVYFPFVLTFSLVIQSFILSSLIQSLASTQLCSVLFMLISYWCI
jgi:hypothetical protein